MIQPDRHRQLLGSPSDLVQLFARYPLNVLKEANALPVPFCIFTNRLARRQELFGPIVPGGRLRLNQPAFFLQRLERGIHLERRALRLDKPL